MAALTSVFLVFTSISVSACDLSCWLSQSQTDCHSGAPMSHAENATSMAASMSMPVGPDGMQQMMAPDAAAGTVPDSSGSFEIGMNHRLTPMPPQPEMAAERFFELANPRVSSTALPDSSRNVSSCAHGICSQLSVSASPPGAGHVQLYLLYCAPVRSLAVMVSLTAGNCTKTGSPPPELHTEHLATILRL